MHRTSVFTCGLNSSRHSRLKVFSGICLKFGQTLLAAKQIGLFALYQAMLTIGRYCHAAYGISCHYMPLSVVEVSLVFHFSNHLKLLGNLSPARCICSSIDLG